MLIMLPSPVIGSCMDLPAAPFFAVVEAVEVAEDPELEPVPVAVAVPFEVPADAEPVAEASL